MFSPENFYRTLTTHFGYAKSNNLIMVPIFPGCKDLNGFIPSEDVAVPDRSRVFPFLFNSQYSLTQLQEVWNKKYRLYDHIILYDQEPLSDASVCTYSKFLRDFKKNSTSEIYNPLTPHLAMRTFRSLKPNIWCHSELNSPDVRNFKNYWFIECYYWYHAMIARDWFRHWQWDYDLMQSLYSRNPSFRFLLYARAVDGTREYRGQLIAALKPIQHQILFDWEKTKNITSDFSATIDSNDALQSSIQIVAETLFDTEKIHLTEKIFKPIVMNQPFILLAGPRSLEYLRHYGFRTFGEFWNEDYDQEPNANTRLEMIVQLIQNLSRLSDQEFTSMYKRMLPTINHNRELFYSSNFQNIVVNEMFTNLNAALDQQKNYEVPPGGQVAYCFDLSLQKNDPMVDFQWQALINDLEHGEVIKMLNHYPRIKQWFYAK